MSYASTTIILEHSGHALTNLGDAAMLQAAVSRLAARFPGATIRVPTSAPDRLARLCPQASPLPSDGLRALAGLGYLPFRHRLPRRAGAGVARLEARLRGARPEWLDALALRRAGRGTGEGRDAAEVLSALDGAALFVAGGGGFVTDAFPDKAWSSLTLLRRAQRRRIPTALVSQGIGPLEEPSLRALAARTLGDADFIALRERRAGPALLERLGVDARRVAVTGDDAVGAAHAARRATEGTALGVNLRSAAYAGLDAGSMAAIGAAIRRLSGELRAPILPVPIALDATGSDAAAIRTAVGDTGGEPDPVDPAGAIARAARCRVVVTASYHAAVFALAQGIPAVGVSRTRYYADKLFGLAEMFGPGADVVSLDEPAWEERLSAAVRDLWRRAAERRPGLIAAAAEQLRLQEEAYGRVASLAGGLASLPAPSRTGAVEASA
ncbi:MAG TPA: polysaccharide pyruvyl transferase family protein [Thermoanaerobaculia bacterium]|nr:polysaccharide pyruvyl transferase family protein [Thermoanaerobaculia bacterium]